MSQDQGIYQEERERLREVLAGILGNKEAAGWVVEEDVGRVEELRRQFLEKRVALVSFDVDKIKEFVFATSKPLELQGASELVSQLTERWIDEILEAKGLTKANKLFAGGGTGLLIVPKDNAQELALEIQNRFAEETRTGSCTAIWQDFAPHELIAGPDPPSVNNINIPSGTKLILKEGNKAIPFGGIFQLLADRLREAKEEKLSIRFPPVSGILHRCESCGMESATQWDTVRTGETQDRICETCALKRSEGRDKRKRLESETPSLQTALTINDIAGTEDRKYFGVLHADANNMGRILSQLPSMVDYALFSQTVSNIMNQTVRDIVSDHRLKNSYQAPIVGGDDILLIIPAKKAAPVAQDLMSKIKKNFNNAADQLGGHVAEHLRNIGMSIGFALVPSHFAIRFASQYAEILLRLAKEKRYEAGEDCIDYLVIKDASPLNVSVSELRELHFRREDPDRWTLDLTDRPVTVSRFREMLDDIRKLRQAGVAQSQLYQIKTLLTQENPSVAALNIRYQWLRVESWKQFCHLKGIQDIAECIRKSGILDRHNSTYRSSFLDLLELYEFMER